MNGGVDNNLQSNLYLYPPQLEPKQIFSIFFSVVL